MNNNQQFEEYKGYRIYFDLSTGLVFRITLGDDEVGIDDCPDGTVQHAKVKESSTIEEAKQWIDEDIRVRVEEREVTTSEVKLQALTLLVKCFATAGHAEIFALEFRQSELFTRQNALSMAIDTYDRLRTDAFELNEPLPDFLNENQRPASMNEALEFWTEYFKEYPCHGEYAGAFCRLLYSHGSWEKLTEILTILEDDINGFEFDN